VNNFENVVKGGIAPFAYERMMKYLNFSPNDKGLNFQSMFWFLQKGKLSFLIRIEAQNLSPYNIIDDKLRFPQLRRVQELHQISGEQFQREQQAKCLCVVLGTSNDLSMKETA
jgi:hypothetical protein